MCSGDLPAARSKERRSVLPSIATTPCKVSAKRCMKRVKQASNGAGSRSRNTRLKVSWLACISHTDVGDYAWGRKPTMLEQVSQRPSAYPLRAEQQSAETGSLGPR